MMILSFLCLKDLCFPVQFVYSNYLGNSFILYLVLLYLEPAVFLLSNISKRMVLKQDTSFVFFSLYLFLCVFYLELSLQPQLIASSSEYNARVTIFFSCKRSCNLTGEANINEKGIVKKNMKV